MAAQHRYLTSILRSFSTFLDNLSANPQVRQTAVELLEEFLAEKQDFSVWNAEEIEQQIPVNSAVAIEAKSLIRNFITQHPPFQTSVFLLEYLLALKSDGCSPATIRNYRSDINQFLSFTNVTAVDEALVKPKVASFVRYQAEKGLKDSSIQRKLKVINQFGLWLQAEEVLAKQAELSTEPREYLQSVTSEQGLGTSVPAPKERSGSGVIPNLFRDLQEITNPSSDSRKAGIQSEGNQHSVTPTPAVTGINSGRVPNLENTLTDSNSMDSLLRGNDRKHSALPSIYFTPEEARRADARKHQEKRARFKSRINDLSSRVQRQTKQLAISYLNFALILLFFLGVAVFGYQQFFTNVEQKLAYPSTLTRANRVLSFQGRLTDQAQNPVTTAKNFNFQLYDAGPATTSGTVLWDSGTCSITPDQDGIFSTGLGSGCGTEIGEDVFTEHSNVWLQVSVAGEVLSPRQPIRTVPYAVNAETVQGYPASQSAVENTVLIMNNDGNIVLGNANPQLIATGDSFSIEAQSLTLRTASGSDGDIVLDPDGLGEIIARSYIAAPGATLSATYAAGVPLTVKGGPSGTGNLTEWQNNAGSALSVVDENGNLGLGTTDPSQRLDVAGAIRLGLAGSNNVLNTSAAGGAATGPLYWGNDELITESTIGSFGVSSVTNSDGTLTISPTTGAVVASLNLANANTWTGAQTFSANTYFPGGIWNTSGNVGIGTTTPGVKLHVAGSGLFSQASSTYLTINSDGSSNLQFQRGLVTKWTFQVDATDDLNVIEDGSSSRLYLQEGGNVGIGTTSPTAALHLGGANANIIVGDGVGTNSDFITFNLRAKFGYDGAKILISDAGTTKNFALNLGGVDRLFVTSAGNVGIGTTNPSYPLHVYTTTANISGLFQNYKTNGDSYAGYFQNSLNADTGNSYGIYVLNNSTNSGNRYGIYTTGETKNYFSGNVGIGTTSPNSKLHVVGANGSGNDDFISLFAESGITAEGSSALATNSDQAVSVQGNGAAYFMARDVTNDIEGIFGTSNSGAVFMGSMTAHDFQLRTGNSIKVTLQQSTGNLGIGTTNPGERLQVTGSIAVSQNIKMAGGYSILGYDALGGAEYTKITTYNGGNASINIGTKHSLGYISFESGNGSYTERMRITNDGLVGINTTSPSDTLHVVGSLRLTGAFKDSVNSAGTSGQVLTTTGTATTWTSLSSLSVGNADTLDTLDSLQFLRSDTSDNYTSGTLTFDTGTTLALASGSTLDVNGNISIADTDIALDGASTNFTATGDLSFNTDDLVVQKSTGYVGIGTTAPPSILSIQANNTGLAIGDINGTVTSGSLQTGIQFMDSGTKHVGFRFDGTKLYYEGASSSSNPSTWYNGSEVSDFIVRNGSLGIGTTSPTGRLQSTISNAAVTATNYSGYFENLSTNTTTDAINKYGLYITSTGTFTGAAGAATNNYGLYVNTPAGADNNYAAIFAGGNVGIGTTAPGAKLHIVTSGIADNLKLDNSGGTSVTGLSLATSGTIKGYWALAAHAGDFSTSAQIGDLVFRSESNNILFNQGAGAATMTIAGSNVGIGTTTFSDRFHVQGDLRVTGAIKDSSGDTGTSGQILSSVGTTTNWIDASAVAGGNASLLDGIDSTEFLRSNATDNYTSGTLTFDTGTTLALASGSILNANAGSTVDINGDLTIADTDIALDGASTNFTATGNFSINTDDLFVQKSNGNVGIGTTSPLSPLQVGRAEGGTTVAGISGAYNDIGTSGNNGTLNLLSTDSAAQGKGGSLTFAGSYSGTTVTKLAGIVGAKENGASGDYAGYLGFYTRAQGFNPTEAMRIASNGNVGIGTATPSQLLDVQKNQTGGTAIRIANTNNTATDYVELALANTYGNQVGGLRLNSGGGSASGFGSFVDTVLYNTYNSSTLGDIAFSTHNGTSQGVRMTIDASGSVGIGTTIPGAKLDFGTSLSGTTKGISLYNNGAAVWYGLGIGSGAMQLYSDPSASTNKIAFGTYNGTTFVENVTFQSGGNVGIGTTSPATKLDVSGPITAGATASTTGVDYLYGNYGSGKLAVLGSLYSSGSTFLGFGVKSSNSSGAYLSSTTINTGRSALQLNSNSIYFLTGATQTSTDGGAVTLTEAMRINSTGLGIGTTTFSDRLHVQGDLRVTGAIKDSSGDTGTSGQILSSVGTTTNWIDASAVAGGNASLLDGIDSTEFLRSNATDNYTSGTLTFDTGTTLALASGSTLNANAGSTVDINGDLSIADTDIALDGATTNFTATGDLSFNTDDLVINKTNGNIGIGTTSSSSKLDIISSGLNTDLQRWMASDGSRLGRFTETSGGHGWFEVDNSTGTAVALLRADGAASYINSGNFGIGTTSPQRLLDIQGSIQIGIDGTNSLIDMPSNSYGDKWYFAGSGIKMSMDYPSTSWLTTVGGATSLTKFRWSATNSGSINGPILDLNLSGDAIFYGNVGIGTTTFSDKLHVQGDLRVTGAIKDSSGDTGTSGQILSSVGTTTNWIDASAVAGGNASLLDGIDSTEFLRSNATDNYTSGTLTFDTGTTLALASGSILNVNGGLAIADTSIDFTGASTNLATTGNFSLNTDQLFVNKTTGYVGVGTTAPAEKLQVDGAARAGSIQVSDPWGNFTFNGHWDSVDARWEYLNDSYAAQVRKEDDVGGLTFDVAADGLADGAITWITGMKVDATGNVGIGTETPSQKLDVNGNFRLRGQLYDYNNSVGTPGQVLSTTATGVDWIDASTLGSDQNLWATFTAQTGTTTANTTTDTLTITGAGNVVTSISGDTLTITGTNLTEAQVEAMIYDADNTLAGAWTTTFGANAGTFNLNSTGDFVIQDAGVAFATFRDDGVFILDSLQLDGTTIGLTTDTDLLSLASGALTVNGSLHITGTLLDSSGDAGTSGQILSSTATGTNWIAAPAGDGGNAGLLDSLDSLQFLRSDTTDNYTSGTLTFDTGTTLALASGSTLNANAGSTVDINGDLTIADTSIALDGASTNFAATGNLSFNTDDLVILKASGNVGIGTTAPTQLLQIHNPATGASNGAYAQFTNGDTLSTASDGLFVGMHANDYGYIVNAENSPLGLGANNILTLQLDETGYVMVGVAVPGFADGLGDLLVADELEVDGNSTFAGNVGIGATTFSDQLHVEGNMRLTGTFKDGANSAGSAGYLLSSTGTGTAWIDASGFSNYWQQVSGALIPKDITNDINLGAVATGSALINLSGTSGYVTSQRFIDTANTGYYLDPAAAGTSLNVAGSGFFAENVGIGTTSTTARLQITAATGATALQMTDGTRTIGSSLSSTYGGLFGTTSNNGLTFMTNNTNRLFLNNEGDMMLGSDYTSIFSPNLPNGSFVLDNGAICIDNSGTNCDDYAKTAGNLYALGTGNNYFAGKVGIGTTNPSGDLHIVNTSAAPQLKIHSAGDGNSYLKLMEDPTAAEGGGYLRYDGSVNRFTIGGMSGGSEIPAINIARDTGTVSIGTTTSNSLLTLGGHITPSSNDSYDLGSSSYRWRDLYLGPDSLYIGASGDQASISYNTSNNYLALSGDAGGADMVINSSGYVGIGTTAPSDELHVNGIINTGTVDSNEVRLGGTTNLAGHEGIGLYYDGATSIGYLTTVDGGAAWKSFTIAASTVTLSPQAGYTTLDAPTDVHNQLTFKENGAQKWRMINNYSNDSFYIYNGNNSGGVYLTQTGNGWAGISDITLKHDIVEETNILERVSNLRTLTYTLRDNQVRELGVSAQEILPYFPEVVTHDGENYAVYYDRLGAIALGGIKEQYQLFKDLQLQVDQNTGMLTNLNAQSVTTNTLTATATQTNSLTTALANISTLNVSNLTVGTTALRDYIINLINEVGVTASNIAGIFTADRVETAQLVSPVVTTNEITADNGQDLVINTDATASVRVNSDLIANSIQTATVESELAKIANLETETATVTGTLEARSARLDLLESRVAEFENIKAQTADLMTATVSGTLYANNIDGFQDKVASALQQPSLLETLMQSTQSPTASSEASVAQLFNVVDEAGYTATGSGSLNKSLSDLNITSEDVVIGASAAFINQYFEVNGTAYIADSLGIGNSLLIGEKTALADGRIEYNATTPEDTLYIQPSGKGTLSLMANLLVLTEDGNVTINGDVLVNGNVKVEDSLLTDLLKPTQFGNPLQIQLSGQVAGTSSGELAPTAGGEIKDSKLEIVNELGTPVATISAQGRAEFAGGLGVGAQDLSGDNNTTLNTNKTSGKATVRANTIQTTIQSDQITTNSLIYVTPLGSTSNQVLYVKAQNNGTVTVGFDSALTSDVIFNWWIVN